MLAPFAILDNRINVAGSSNVVPGDGGAFWDSLERCIERSHSRHAAEVAGESSCAYFWDGVDVCCAHLIPWGYVSPDIT